MIKNCYVWTRVSTKHQEENGGSLADQKCRCERYARDNGYTIKGYFGGTHESAKTPGKLIKEMIYAIKKDKTTVPPRYLVFFKGRDADVLTQAFKEFVKVNEKISQSLSTRKPFALDVPEPTVSITS